MMLQSGGFNKADFCRGNIVGKNTNTAVAEITSIAENVEKIKNLLSTLIEQRSQLLNDSSKTRRNRKFSFSTLTFLFF